MKGNLLRAMPLILITCAFSWLIVLAFNNAGGIIAASLLALLVTVLTLAGKIPFEKYHMTLLLDVILVVMGVLMIVLIDTKQFLPFSILIMLGAVFGIIAWFADENNKNKSWKQVMSEEFRLPPLIDVLLVVSIIVNLVKGVTDIPLFVSYTILALLAIDFIRQIKKLKNHEIFWI